MEELQREARTSSVWGSHWLGSIRLRDYRFFFGLFVGFIGLMGYIGFRIYEQFFSYYV